MKVAYEVVRNSFLIDHPLNKGSNRPAFWNIDKANEQFSGKWSYRTLGTQEILGVVLSHHDHWMEAAAIQLVPDAGLTVAETISRYQSLEDYQISNPLCWRTIEYLKTSTTDVYLSSRPIDTEDFRPLNRFISPHLFVLDGLHRLIARGLAGNYTEQELQSRPVNAYIAGDS